MNIPEVNDKFLAQMIASLHIERTGNKNQIGSTKKTVESLMPDILMALEEVSKLGDPEPEVIPDKMKVPCRECGKTRNSLGECECIF